MKKLILILGAIIFSINANSQLSEEKIKSLKGNPTNLIEDTYHQKKDKDVFKTNKHTKYTLDLKNNKIQTQISIDTLGGFTPYHYKYDYIYENDYIISITEKTLKGELKNVSKFYYDKNYFKNKAERYNDFNAIVSTITYTKKKCANADNSCVTSYLKNNFSTYKFDEEYNSIDQLIKKISYQRESEDEVSSTITYLYNEKGRLISEEKTLSSGRGFTTTYKYDEKGNLVHKKARFVEFYYAYKYDEKENWIERIETTKVKSKRIITKRTFTY